MEYKTGLLHILWDVFVVFFSYFWYCKHLQTHTDTHNCLCHLTIMMTCVFESFLFFLFVLMMIIQKEKKNSSSTYSTLFFCSLSFFLQIFFFSSSSSEDVYWWWCSQHELFGSKFFSTVCWLLYIQHWSIHLRRYHRNKRTHIQFKIANNRENC